MKQLYLLLFFMTSFQLLEAQYYYLPYLKVGKNPGGINVDNEYPPGGGLPTGWATILTGPQASGVWSAVQTIPFKFYFNGALVTRCKASTSGLVTFNSKTTMKVDSNNVALPTSLIPDSTVCIWGLRAASGDYIVTKTFGKAPNRQYWISFNSFGEQNLKAGWIYASVVLEETTNKIFIVDQRTQCVLSGAVCMDKTNLTLGVQVDSTYAVMVDGSPDYKSDNLNNFTPEDNSYFEFIQGTQATEDILGLNHDFKKYYLVKEFPISVVGNFRNTGTENISKITYNYSVDNGPVYTQEITGQNAAPLSDFQITHPDLWTVNSKGSYTVKSWISLVNDKPSSTVSDDTIRSVVNVNDTSITRKLLHENFTSSTCPPCKPGNETLHGVLNNYPDLWTELNYHFYFPGTGDPYYTAECATRSTYYGGINAIPATLVDGRTNINPNGYTAQTFVENQEIPAFYQIIPSGTVNGQKIDVRVEIKNIAPVSATTKLYVAIAEKLTVKNVKTNGEVDFPHVLKKLIPDAAGTLVGIVPAESNKTINLSWTAPGSYRLPLDAQAANIINLATENSIEDFANLEVIAWLQESDRTVLQSNSADLTFIVANNDPVLKREILVSPNPASDFFFINLSAFDLTQDLKILISDANGKLIYTDKTSLKSMFINSSTWNPGFYNIKVIGKNQEANNKIIILE
ncbi:MAG: T9SS type A sorting domain-containing protein [Saprospiraceae bacterium]|nr:T9SS type A sorting domain-containing protein [Saprospiraceae bacterium]